MGMHRAAGPAGAENHPLSPVGRADVASSGLLSPWHGHGNAPGSPIDFSDAASSPLGSRALTVTAAATKDRDTIMDYLPSEKKVLF